MRMLDRAGFALVVVTDQPGLAMGRFTRADFARLEGALVQRLREEAGIELAGLHACPHAPGPNGTPRCLCHKPAPGLLKQAALAHRLDLAASWMVGDLLDDIEAGRRAGCGTVLLDVGSETAWRLSPLRTPDQRCPDLLEAARWITQAPHPQHEVHLAARSSVSAAYAQPAG
jgi:histidinol-phosphate phosphatase family protein